MNEWGFTAQNGYSEYSNIHVPIIIFGLLRPCFSRIEDCSLNRFSRLSNWSNISALLGCDRVFFPIMLSSSMPGLTYALARRLQILSSGSVLPQTNNFIHACLKATTEREMSFWFIHFDILRQTLFLTFVSVTEFIFLRILTQLSRNFTIW